MKRFVVDASVAMKWFIPEIHSPAAARLLEEQLHLCAPDLLVCDSFYLALAVALSCPLITADVRFHAAARSSPLAPHVAWVEDEL